MPAERQAIHFVFRKLAFKPHLGAGSDAVFPDGTPHAALDDYTVFCRRVRVGGVVGMIATLRRPEIRNPGRITTVLPRTVVEVH